MTQIKASNKVRNLIAYGLVCFMTMLALFLVQKNGQDDRDRDLATIDRICEKTADSDQKVINAANKLTKFTSEDGVTDPATLKRIREANQSKKEVLDIIATIQSPDVCADGKPPQIGTTTTTTR